MSNILKKIPWSGFFWWLILGVLVTTTTIFTVLPGYKLRIDIPKLVIDDVSEDTITLDRLSDAATELYREISLQYVDVDKIDQAKMVRQALSAMVNSLWDPFSSYLPPVESQEFEESIMGDDSFEGIGAVLSQKDRGVMIEEVLKWSPAVASELMSLDYIVKVDGELIQWLELPEVVRKIRGPKDTIVTLSIMRISGSGDNEKIELLTKEVVRDTIVVPSVSSKLLQTYEGKQIGYIALSRFIPDTESRLNEEIQWLLAQDIQWFILDLRGNGWGLLPESVSVASRFLSKWLDVTQVKYRIYTDTTYKAQGNPLLIELPMVILIDGYSASASEIIALAISQQRCKGWFSDSFNAWCSVALVWTTTFGKWTIQQLHNLQMWWSLKLTVGKRFGPDGTSIDEVGIVPDIEIEFDREAYQENDIDNQLEQALQLL